MGRGEVDPPSVHRASAPANQARMPWRPCRRLAPVAIEVAGHGAFDAVPGVAGGFLGAVPAQARLVLGAVPVATQVAFHVLEALAFVAGARLPAVAVGRAVVFLVGVA